PAFRRYTYGVDPPHPCAVMELGFVYNNVTGKDRLHVREDGSVGVGADYIDNRAAHDLFRRELQPTCVGAVRPQIAEIAAATQDPAGHVFGDDLQLLQRLTQTIVSSRTINRIRSQTRQNIEHAQLALGQLLRLAP